MAGTLGCQCGVCLRCAFLTFEVCSAECQEGPFHTEIKNAAQSLLSRDGQEWRHACLA